MGWIVCTRLLFRSFLCGMQDRGDAETGSVNSIADNIRCARHNEFARFGFSARMPEMGMPGETFGGI